MTIGNGHRLGTVDADHTGTSSAAWARFRGTLTRLDWSSWTRVLVVAPHPDDEVLGVGGIMATVLRAGVPVEVIGVTDGEAARPPSWMRDGSLAQVRVDEGTRGCAVLDVATPTRLGLPDGGLGGCERGLAELLAGHLDRGVACLATWAGDGHPDHEAVGRAARRACDATGADLVEYPVWTWHWATPGSPAVPWTRARRVDLDRDATELKRRAVACHRSQLDPPGPGESPVLPDFVVDRLVTDHEVVFV